MSMKGFFKYAAALLAVLLLLTSLPACSESSEVPDGYQYATCAGEYFRLFVPLSWSVTTASGISGATLNMGNGQFATVSMKQMPYAPTNEDGTSVAEPTLDGFMNHHVEEISTLYEYKTVDAPIEVQIDGFRAVRLSYSAKVDGVTYQFRQVLSKVEGRFYLFSFSATPEAFETEVDEEGGTLSDMAGEIQDHIRFDSEPYEGNADTREVPDDVKAPEGMKLISTDGVAFRFFAPTAWETDSENGANLVWTQESDGSRSNVSMLTYMPEFDGYSVDDYWTDMCYQQYKNNLPTFTLLSADENGEPGGEAGKLGDRNAKLYTYTYTLGGNTYKTRQAICVYATSIYVLTYTALEEHFDIHLAEVDAMQAAVVFRSPFKGE